MLNKSWQVNFCMAVGLVFLIAFATFIPSSEFSTIIHQSEFSAQAQTSNEFTFEHIDSESKTKEVTFFAQADVNNFSSLPKQEGAENKVFTEAEINGFRRIMTETSNYLNPKKGQAVFQKSDLDSKGNYHKVMSQLEEDYPLSGKERAQFIQNRIISVNFFLQSKFIKQNDCRNVFDKLSDQFRNAQAKSTQVNIELDANFVAKRCAQDFREDFQLYISKANLPDSLFAQANNQLNRLER